MVVNTNIGYWRLKGFYFELIFDIHIFWNQRLHVLNPKSLGRIKYLQFSMVCQIFWQNTVNWRAKVIPVTFSSPMGLVRSLHSRAYLHNEGVVPMLIFDLVCRPDRKLTSERLLHYVDQIEN